MEFSPWVINFIENYGYMAVFLGSLVEGEALVIIASFFSYLGQMSLFWVLVAAFLGTWLSDVLWFLIGRHSGSRFLEKWPLILKLSDQSIKIVGKKPKTMAFFMRFMYGLRLIIPYTLGKTSMPTISFVFYNALGVMLWAGVFASIGYFFGTITESAFGRMKHLEIILPMVVVTTLICFIYSSQIVNYLLKIYPKRTPTTEN